MKIVKNKYGFEDTAVLAQIRNEYTDGYEHISNKRKIMEQHIKNKYVPVVYDDKVAIHSIYTAIQTLLSVYYSDTMLVEFAARKVSAIEKADNLNLLSKFDYDEMGLDKIDYTWIWNSFFFGVGIKLIDGWDKHTSTPIARTIDTLSWIPDPLGGFDISSHRYAGFELKYTKEQLSNKGFDNVGLVNSSSYGEQDVILEAYKSGRGLINGAVENTPNKKYNIYLHYTMIGGAKYAIYTANHNTVILSMEKLVPVLTEEKKDNSKIPFPIALRYYSPLKGDSYGISIPGLLVDKQSAESKLFNLTLITATRNALGEDRLYNPKKIKNINELKTPTVEAKRIAANVRDGEALSSAIYEIEKTNPGRMPIEMQSSLRFQSSISTGMDSNTLGIQSDSNSTATEAQITQKNSNLRFILGTKVAKWGEKSFWKLWFRSYAANLSRSSKKAIRIENEFNTKYYELGRNDFITSEIIDISIISKSEKESKKNKQKMDLFAIAPQFLQDPTIPEISKTYLKRKMLRLSNIEEEEILKIIPKTVDERVAELDIELMNSGYDPADILPGQDHLSFIEIYQTADDGEIKAKAIANREKAYIEDGQKEIKEAMSANEDNTAGNIAQSNASSRMSSNMINEAKNNSTPSLESVME